VTMPAVVIRLLESIVISFSLTRDFVAEEILLDTGSSL
jgi:hypothetical protein